MSRAPVPRCALCETAPAAADELCETCAADRAAVLLVVEAEERGLVLELLGADLETGRAYVRIRRADGRPVVVDEFHERLARAGDALVGVLRSLGPPEEREALRRGWIDPLAPRQEEEP